MNTNHIRYMRTSMILFFISACTTGCMQERLSMNDGRVWSASQTLDKLALEKRLHDRQVCSRALDKLRSNMDEYNKLLCLVSVLGEGGALPSLSTCIRHGLSTRTINCLIEAGAYIGTDSDRDNPLCCAVSERNIDCVKSLIAAGANVDDVDLSGYTPLHRAVESNWIDCIKLLLAHKANPNITNQAGDTPMHLAVRKHLSDCIEFLATGEGKKSLAIYNKAGHAPLHLAVQVGHTLCSVKCLIAAGADLNMRNKEGKCLLHFAVESGRIGMVRLVMEDLGQADLHVFSHQGESPLHSAVNTGKLDMLRFVMEHGGAAIMNHNSKLFLGKCESLMATIGRAAETSRPAEQAFRDLASRGYFFPKYHSSAAVPLYAAANHYNHFDLAPYLLEQGADIELALRQAHKLKNQRVIDRLNRYKRERADLTY